MAIFKKMISDNIHGTISLTKTEDEIVETAYYQRLRWIKQLGFTFYLFPGATHTRFSHALGVLHVMDRVLKAIGLAVSDEKLFNPKVRDPQTEFHRKMRLAALLHDIGTFPFSHTIELAYINHWKRQRDHGFQLPMANHERLGSHIIQNTDFPGGITPILREGGIDPRDLSETIGGNSPLVLANQLLHSDIDADRMDYLLRDAHHTGVKYGVYDLDQLLKSLVAVDYNGQKILCVHESGLNVAEYFLISRFFWYSQIIEDSTGYKFDLIAAKIAEYFLEMGQAFSFDELTQDITQ